MDALAAELGLGPDDGLCFAAGKEAVAAKLAGLARTRVAEQLDLIDPNKFEMCWIVDFPMFEPDEDTGQIDFSHTPFSMPKGELAALATTAPIDILAWQSDIEYNVPALSSDAIRNNPPTITQNASDTPG